MCFIDQSGRDHPFRLDETHVRVKKYCVLSIKLDGGAAGYLHGVVTKPVRTPTARAVWGKIPGPIWGRSSSKHLIKK